MLLRRPIHLVIEEMSSSFSWGFSDRTELSDLQIRTNQSRLIEIVVRCAYDCYKIKRTKHRTHSCATGDAALDQDDPSLQGREIACVNRFGTIKPIYCIELMSKFRKHVFIRLLHIAVPPARAGEKGNTVKLLCVITHYHWVPEPRHFRELKICPEMNKANLLLLLLLSLLLLER